jgi:hypothetical protein
MGGVCILREAVFRKGRIPTAIVKTGNNIHGIDPDNLLGKSKKQ